MCVHAKCSAKLTSDESFRKHIYCHHNYATGNGNCSCTILNWNYTFSSMQYFHKHMKIHIQTSKDGVSCPFESCSRNSTMYRNVNSYTVHVFRQHATNDIVHLENLNESFENDSIDKENVSSSFSEFSVTSLLLSRKKFSISSKVPQYIRLIELRRCWEKLDIERKARVKIV